MRKSAVFITILILTMLSKSALYAQETGGQLSIDGRVYNQVAETEYLRLLIEEEMATFVVEDRRTGYLWTSFVPQNEASYQDANRVWQRNMTSLFLFTTVNLNDDLATRRNLNVVSPQRTIETSIIDHGVRFDVYFPSYGLGLSLLVTIRGDALELAIPAESIIEETEQVFVAITPLPFFGYAKPTDDGYMVIPDGSGALYYYKPSQSKSMASEKKVSWYVYAPKEVEFEKYRELYADLINPAYMPVFGVKLGDHGFIASVDEGDTDAYIHFNEYGFAVDLTRIHTEFTVRNSYELYLSEINVQGSLPDRDIVPTRYDENRIGIDRKIRYQFLNGSEATYSGMARAYRRHLMDSGILTKVVSPNEIPLGLALFGGIFEERLLFDKYVSMTTFPQAAEIINALTDQGISSLHSVYIGWARKGYMMSPIIWPPDLRLGGKRGLRKLSESIDNEAVSLYLQIDPILAFQGNGRFNIRTDAVMQRTNLAVRSKMGNSLLLNPAEAYSRVSDLIERLKVSGVDGVSYESIGEFLFHDYNRRAPSQRHETLATWNEMADLSKESLGASAIVMGNIRQADNVDLIMRLPMETSGYMVIDEMIPFYQMVLHGSVHYTTDPENLFYDTRRQYLKWIETGAIPFYELTYERSERLAYTEYNYLFTSYYEDWIDVAAERYHEFNREFGDFYHLEMIDHAMIAPDVVQVTYKDGSRILLNYGSEPVMVDSVEVDSMDYRTVRPGEVQKGNTE